MLDLVPAAKRRGKGHCDATVLNRKPMWFTRYRGHHARKGIATQSPLAPSGDSTCYRSIHARKGAVIADFGLPVLHEGKVVFG